MSNNIKSIDRIISAKDYGGSMKGYLKKCQRDFLKQRGLAVTIVDVDKTPEGTPVEARIWQSQWIANCECNTSMFVDPEDPIFFCFGCGNRLNGGKPRPVIFPPEAERLEIERLLLERPVADAAGLTDLERVGLQKALLMAEIEEVDEDAFMQQSNDLAAGKGLKGKAMPTVPTRVTTKPLTRSWEPGETIADLERQQRKAIQSWKKELRHVV